MAEQANLFLLPLTVLFCNIVLGIGWIFFFKVPFSFFSSEVPNLWAVAHYQAMALWPPGCVNSWAVHTHVCRCSSPLCHRCHKCCMGGGSATSIMWEVALPQTLCRWRYCHKWQVAHGTSLVPVAASLWATVWASCGGRGGMFAQVVASSQAWQRWRHKSHTGADVTKSLMLAALFVWSAGSQPVCVHVAIFTFAHVRPLPLLLPPGTNPERLRNPGLVGELNHIKSNFYYNFRLT